VSALAWTRDRPTVRLALTGVSLIGFVLCLQALLRHGIVGNGGEGGGDVFAYWTAGRHVLAGAPVYGAGVGGYAAFLYPPPLAQLFAPLGLVPFPVAVWVWRAVELVCLRVAVGSWRNAGLAMLLWPPVISELDAANVHLIVAAAVAMAIRGDARAIVPAAITKFASLAAVPLALAADRRGLVVGAAIAGAICAVSMALGPQLWVDYVTFMTAGVPVADSGWFNLGASIPLALRFGAAAVVALVAIRWQRLAGVAATLALPVLWLHGLSALVAVAAQPGPRVNVKLDRSISERVALNRRTIPNAGPRTD
jgi:hypothetical protein